MSFLFNDRFNDNKHTTHPEASSSHNSPYNDQAEYEQLLSKENGIPGEVTPTQKILQSYTHSNFAHILTFFALKSTFLVLNCTTFITCFDNKQNRTKL